MKLRIDNATDYRTDDLRKLIVLALKEADVWHLPYYLVTIRWAGKAGQCGGHGYLQRPQFQLTLPRRMTSLAWQADAPELTELPPGLVKQLAQVAVHEIHHTKGEKHGDMPEDVNNWWNLKVEWAEDLQVRRRPPKAKPKVDKEQKARETVARIEELIAAEERRHKTRLKGLRTRLAKAKRSVGYYDRKAAARRPK